MPHPLSRTLPALCLLAWACSAALADEPSPSLYEKRLGVIKGTAKGIVIWGGDKPEATAATPASTTATSTSSNKSALASDSKPTATAPQPHAEAPTLLNAVSPPSGRSLNDARRLGAVGGGITLPTKATQTPSPEPGTKP